MRELSCNLETEVKEQLTPTSDFSNYIMQRQVTSEGITTSQLLLNLNIEAQYTFNENMFIDAKNKILIGYKDEIPGLIKTNLLGKWKCDTIEDFKKEVLDSFKKKATKEIIDFKRKLLNEIEQSFSEYSMLLKEEKKELMKKFDNEIVLEKQSIESSEKILLKIEHFFKNVSSNINI